MTTTDATRYYQGPTELALALERRFPPHLRFLSSRGLQKLVGLSYRVSLMKEEGRYPCFQILVPQFDEQLADLAIQFQAPLSLDSEVLHRLAPGVPERPFALVVQESGKEELLAHGIGRAESSGLALHEHGEQGWVQTRPWGISLYVTGPGQMMASLVLRDTGVPYSSFLSISNGVIRNINQFNSGWLEVGVGIHHSVSILWPKILTEAQAFGHGGMFVILPTDSSLDGSEVIRVEHRTTEPDLGAIYDELVTKQDAASERRLFDAVRTVVQLSAVDGCVVLSSTMQLLGFAGEVSINTDEHLPEAVLVNLNPPRPPQVEPVNLRRFGTRHRSAARVCNELGARVFVVSQDGAIRAFERLHDGRVSIRGPFACGPGLSPDPLSGTIIERRQEAPAGPSRAW